MSLHRILKVAVAGLAVVWLTLLALPAHALSGADTAYLINQRYRATPSKCFVGSPAFECSGVLIRTAPRGDNSGNFWRLGPDDVAAGYATLSYLRIDQPGANPPDSVGFVMTDRPAAASAGQPYELMCGRAPLGQTLPPCPGDPQAVGVNLWQENAPSALAVQAVYYDVAHGGQLAQALRYQLQYFDATRIWVPILKASLGNGAATVFGFDERDQLEWGYAVIKDLEARYLDTRMTCPGNTPGYNCSGVLIRITGYGTTFHSWNPSDNSVSRNGVSFSYARSDMKLTTTITGGPGVIMRELQAPAAHPLEWRCAFPLNASTSSRADSCNTGADYRLCDARGINTAAQWRSAYGASPASACGLSPTIAQFGVLVELRQTLFSGHNEVIIASWPQNIPTEISLEALFYPTSDAKAGALYIQQDYMATTGRFMPVLSVNLTQPPGSMFSYNPLDQTGALQPGAVLAIPGDGRPDPAW
ncbi:hypothetical protein [Pandoraea sp. NPDC087047]|uniref:hypothetical protein n=1 Tax=Pandoraea sp. NPDC087047 TaxID=3364390 RepID=UPI003803DEFE